jgi:hypothetical protein
MSANPLSARHAGVGKQKPELRGGAAGVDNLFEGTARRRRIAALHGLQAVPQYCFEICLSRIHPPLSLADYRRPEG